jgi:hypothetical protein
LARGLSAQGTVARAIRRRAESDDRFGTTKAPKPQRKRQRRRNQQEKQPQQTIDQTNDAQPVTDAQDDGNDSPGNNDVEDWPVDLEDFQPPEQTTDNQEDAADDAEGAQAAEDDDEMDFDVSLYQYRGWLKRKSFFGSDVRQPPAISRLGKNFVRRLARRGGVKRIDAEMYTLIKSKLRDFLDRVIRTSILIMSNDDVYKPVKETFGRLNPETRRIDRRTVITYKKQPRTILRRSDVQYALQLIGRPLY